MAVKKLPYFKDAWDVTPATITLTRGMSVDGEPQVAGTWTGNVNFSEAAKRVQDKDGLWVRLSAVVRAAGDIMPGVVFTEGTCIVGGNTHKVVGFSRPRNPDGTVNHTRLELI